VHRVLFDAGASPDGVLENMRRLDIDPTEMEAIVCSHGHFDHVAGLAGLLSVLGPTNKPLLIHPHFWRRRRVILPGRNPLELQGERRRSRSGARPGRKRTDLRLVGLALVVTRDGGIPLLSHAYPGDRPDVTQFASVIGELSARFRELAGGVESLTVVYDAGQNSEANHAVIEASTMGFIGSLPPSQHPDLRTSRQLTPNV
jgi:hypothetical protein